jgi:hypothetical protein
MCIREKLHRFSRSPDRHSHRGIPGRDDPTSTALWRLAAQLFGGKVGDGPSDKERTDATKALGVEFHT